MTLKIKSLFHFVYTFNHDISSLCQNIQGLINKPRELSTLSRNKCCIPAFGCRNAERYNHSHSKHFGRVSRKKTLKSKYPPLYQWKPDSKILTAIINLTQAKIIAVFCISFLQQDRNVRKHWKVFSIFFSSENYYCFLFEKKYYWYWSTIKIFFKDQKLLIVIPPA